MLSFLLTTQKHNITTTTTQEKQISSQPSSRTTSISAYRSSLSDYSINLRSHLFLLIRLKTLQSIPTMKYGIPISVITSTIAACVLFGAYSRQTDLEYEKTRERSCYYISGLYRSIFPSNSKIKAEPKLS